MNLYIMCSSDITRERRTGLNTFEIIDYDDIQNYNAKTAHQIINSGGIINIKSGTIRYNLVKTKEPVTICKHSHEIFVRDSFVEALLDKVLTKCFTLPIVTEPQIDANILIVPTLEPYLVFDFSKTRIIEETSTFWHREWNRYVENVHKYYGDITFTYDYISDYDIFLVSTLESDYVFVSQKFVDEFKNSKQFGVEFIPVERYNLLAFDNIFPEIK